MLNSFMLTIDKVLDFWSNVKAKINVFSILEFFFSF